MKWFPERSEVRLGPPEMLEPTRGLPVTAIVDQFYSEVQRMGGKRWDTSSLIARLNNADKKQA